MKLEEELATRMKILKQAGDFIEQKKAQSTEMSTQLEHNELHAFIEHKAQVDSFKASNAS